MLASTCLFTLLSILGVSVTASPIAEHHSLAKRYSGVKIKSGRNGLCLTPTGPWREGMHVGTLGCDIGAKWDINPGSGSVILHGYNLALDAGTGNTNNELLKLWTPYPGLFQQTWYLTDDNRIAITGGNQCLDEAEGGPQTYQCTSGNANQVWYIVESPPEANMTTFA
ncbi:uncharacterized protein L203_106312 [Cryptococcus depauperatus CBS 7841]|uniref:Uncharacterized protein n=1 Tax=Cryptococcus depauperatus CBS 7841 TaxID=1295531 RepID=A0A1E3IJ94_9TREE|nr:hypothetical protein L203_02690 [Cryptococcus depauperatus CBS 7841]